MAEFVKIASVDDIPVGTMKSFQRKNQRYIICRTEDNFYALADECSHDYVPLSLGHIEGKEVVCARHGARFLLETGDATAPPAVAGIDTYEIKIENNEIFVMLD